MHANTMGVFVQCRPSQAAAQSRQYGATGWQGQSNPVFAPDTLAMSVITLGELYFGAEKSHSRAAAQASIERLTASIQVHDLPFDAASHYGQIRASLQSQGQIIGNNALWLAAHARAARMILVTNNEREFNRVPDLRVENWAK